MLAVVLCACGGTDNNESSASASESSKAEIAGLSLENAKELIAHDREITEMFICNSLCGDTDDAIPVAVPKGHKYASFAEIEKLIDKTYLSDSSEKEFFLNYPNKSTPAVYEQEGKTYVFKHSGAEFKDFIDAATVKVAPTEESTVYSIKAVTETGRNVELFASYVNKAWYLKTGIYSTCKPKYTEFDKKYLTSDIGSLSEFRGNILVIECYISDRVTSFSTASEKTMHENIETAVEYLAEESRKLGNTVSVDYQAAHFYHVGVIDKTLDFDIFFAETSFGTLQGFAESQYELSNYDNYFFVVCFDKPFIAESTAFEGKNEEVRFGERIIASVETDSAELAELILNLSGSMNLLDDENNEYIKSLYSYYFPDDLYVKNTLDKTSISPVTAYFCGMANDLEQLYRVFYIENKDEAVQ